MEHFRSSGTSGGLLYSRTESAYVKARAEEFLRAVGQADAYVIARGSLRPADVEALKQCVAAIVSESWLLRNAEQPDVAAFHAVDASLPPELADRALSNVLRCRYPVETVRPALNSRWG